MRINKNVVWSDPTAEQCCHESMGKENDADFKIANDLADKIAAIVTSGYGNREIVKNLISNAIVEQIRQYLREYDNVAAEDMLNSLKGWKLGELKGWTSEVDFNHARHAKLSSFGDEVTELIKNYRDNNSLVKIRKQILKLNPIPGTELDNNDGKIWLSNVLTIIDEELGVNKKEVVSTDEIQKEIKFNDGLDD